MRHLHYVSLCVIYGGYWQWAVHIIHKLSICFVRTDQWASGQQWMEVRKAIIPAWLKCHKNEEKIDNDHILRNYYRIKTTQPISIILV